MPQVLYACERDGPNRTGQTETPAVEQAMADEIDLSNKPREQAI